ncbi:MAG: 50S ribosomal protein L9 [Deltaproteobacteria bacterium GWC2_42_11]|nr:MAG: 50S ribosomal protein L9 [Deltaproteobacteria bacterium GWC2_42_11]HBO84645.1 50S ribosomal protein L9 [Deltaproteobacteria bacterium]
MNVILKEEIHSLGRLGQIIKVVDGYARNYLIPRGFAVEATPQNVRIWENEKRGVEKKLLKLKEDALKLCAEIEKVSCEFSRKAGEDGKLFGSVTSMDIECFLKERGFTVDRRKILLHEPIKITGEHTVPVKLHPDVTASIKVVIAAE